MHRILRAATVLAFLSTALAAAFPAAAQAARKLVRLHAASPAGPGVDNTMLAHPSMTCVNANSNTVQVDLFPNRQLGEARR